MTCKHRASVKTLDESGKSWQADAMHGGDSRRVISCNLFGRTKPQKHKTRHKGRDRCPDKRGISMVSATAIIPENLTRCKPFFVATAQPCLIVSGPPAGSLNPNGEAMSFAATPPVYQRPRREKMFGMGRPRALDRNAKVRIMHLARALMRRTEKGKAYGAITAKALAVLEAMLWSFHNAKSGLCFPSYEKIAEAACCARSTVAEALKALEDAGILSWVNRIKRVAETTRDLFGHSTCKTRVIRTSNGYAFIDPKGGQTPATLANSSKSDFPTGTPNQGSLFLMSAAAPRALNPDNPLEGALIRLGRVLGAAV
jgi:Helix-turn-helix domain